jgi:hypothetical protein
VPTPTVSVIDFTSILRKPRLRSDPLGCLGANADEGVLQTDEPSAVHIRGNRTFDLQRTDTLVIENSSSSPA